MPFANPPSVGSPGDVIDAADLNTAFDAFTDVIDGTNLRVDAVSGYHIAMGAVNSAAGGAKNTGTTTVTYTGTTYQVISHGTPLITGGFVISDEATLRVHWHQFATNITLPAGASLDEFVTFKLQWDLGAGYVDIPDLLLWAVSGYTSNASGNIDQTDTHNLAGGWCYTNNTGASITVVGVRLMIRPALSDAAGSVDLVEGTVIYIVQSK